MLQRACLAAAAIAAAVLTTADFAAACTCADRDERDRLEDGEIGVLGEVVGRRELYSAKHPTLDGQPLVRAYDYRLRVRRGVGARFAAQITVRVPEDGCGPGTFEVGERLAAFVRKRRYGWLTHGCSIADSSNFERALRPYPRGRGRGRLALLAGGHFGEARLMALDARGRVLAYGFGAGEVQEISVCPGGAVATELVARRSGLFVAARDLGSLRVLWSAKLPLSGARFQGGATVRCYDAAASVVRAAAMEDTPRTAERTRIFGVAPTGAAETASVRGFAPHLGLQSAYLTDRRRLLAVGLANGTVRQLARLRYDAEPLEESPDGRRLAFHDGERLRLIDLTSGAGRSAPARSGWTIAWLSEDRFLFRRGGEGRIYDTRLRLLRRYPFFRLVHEAHVGGRLLGIDGFRLGALDLASGRRRTVAQLPDRGVLALEGVPAGTLVDTDPAAPGLGFSTTARSARACRPAARG